MASFSVPLKFPIVHHLETRPEKSMPASWSYPASLVALGAFMVYQIYRYSYTYSAGLLVLTVFDAIVMVLIWHE
jgi:uncharacterized membrane protein